jgi:hypothetical protein
MHPDELESLLARVTVEEVTRAIDDPAVQARRGWDLHNWAYRTAPGSVCFLHADDSGRPTEVVVAVCAPRERRDRLARLVADFPVPAKLVLLDGRTMARDRRVP